MKNKTIYTILAIFVASIFAFAACDEMLEAIIGKVTVKMFKKGVETQLILEDDGIHVILAGTGSPRIDPDRSHPCTAIIANGEFLIFDAGPAALRRLAIDGHPTAHISRIFLTHLHSDHMGGVGSLINLSFVAGRRNILTIHGPDDSKNLTHSLYPPTSREYRVGQEDTTPGGLPDTRSINELTTDDLATGIVWNTAPEPDLVYIPGVKYMVDGINQAFAPDAIIRTSNKQAPPGDDHLEFKQVTALADPIEDMSTAGVSPDYGWGELQEVYRTPNDTTPIIVYAFLVDHYPAFPSYGYRIEYAGRVVVISGDTESLIPHNDPLASETSYWATYAADADILVHEANKLRMSTVMLNAIQAWVEEEYPEGDERDHLSEWVARMRSAIMHHIDVADVAKAAQEAGVDTLVLTHIMVPMSNKVIKNYFMKGMNQYFTTGKIVMAEDGMDIHLPPK